MKDPETGRMVRTGNEKAVIANFRHDSSRNLDPALHTHAVIANMATSLRRRASTSRSAARATVPNS
jgi:conjugative relaxase-like TrwC/TraI family protein